MKSDGLLVAAKVSKVFGGLRAVDDVSFALPRGAIAGLIGPNGAGKTTLFNCLAGSLKPTPGQVWLDGRPIAGAAAAAASSPPAWRAPSRSRGPFPR